MKFSAFAVAHERGDASALFDDPLGHCYSGKQLLVLTFSRQALMDYLRVPATRASRWRNGNLVVGCAR